MRLSAIQLFLAGAGLAVQQVAASPLRVVVVTSHQEITSNAEIGSDSANVATLVRPEMFMPRPKIIHHIPANMMEEASGAGHHHGRRPCKSLKDKALAISNKFRVTFGFAPIEAPPKDHDIPVFKPVAFRHGPVITPEIAETMREEHRMERHHYRLHGSFLHRVHHALMALGPWEGRAVAFVLGCGLGVLLRMIWVMTIVTYRLLRGSRDSEGDITQGDMYYEGVVLFETADAEELPAPPQYVDEKAVLAAADKAAAAEN